MNWKIAERLSRTRQYLDRVVRDIRDKDVIQAMADSAELQYQAQVLYKELERYLKAEKAKLNEQQDRLQSSRARDSATGRFTN